MCLLTFTSVHTQMQRAVQAWLNCDTDPE